MLKRRHSPSSIDGIKRLAKRIKKTEAIPHHEALNIASQFGSFENYTHARAKLGTDLRRQNKNYRFFLTVYWEDTSISEQGRETLEVLLSRPFLDICSKPEMKIARGLQWFRCVASDHIVSDDVKSQQSAARKIVNEALRTLRFMEGTGLKPAKKSDIQYPSDNQICDLPQRDHLTEWLDPTNGQFILIDEPYSAAVVKEDRVAWAKKYNWHLEKASWPGMYFPHQCALYVGTDASTEYDFNALINRINGLTEPVSDDSWDGISVNNHEVFISPAAVSPQDVRRAKAKGTIYRLPTKDTVPLDTYSVTNERKPRAVMPIEAHIEIGRAFKAVMQSGPLGDFIWSRMSSLRSNMEKWLFVEYEEDDFADLDFLHVYYNDIDDNDPYVHAAKSNIGKARVLNHVKQLLQKHYPVCAPLNEVIRKIDSSVKRLQNNSVETI